MNMESFMVDIMLPVGFVLLLVAVVFAVLGPIITSISDPKSIIKPVAALVGILIVFAIGYSVATGKEHLIKQGADIITVDAGTSRWIGGALMTFYILLIGAIISIVYSEVSKFFK